MLSKRRKEYIYHLDADHRINFVNDAWLEFASENGAPDLQRDDVLNKSIWDFMADRETRHLFDIVFKKLKATSASIQLPFRCDSPDCRRFMTMEILAQPEGHIQFKSWITKEEVRPPVRLLDLSTGRMRYYGCVAGARKFIFPGMNGWKSKMPSHPWISSMRRRCRNLPTRSVKNKSSQAFLPILVSSELFINIDVTCHFEQLYSFLQLILSHRCSRIEHVLQF